MISNRHIGESQKWISRSNSTDVDQGAYGMIDQVPFDERSAWIPDPSLISADRATGTWYQMHTVCQKIHWYHRFSAYYYWLKYALGEISFVSWDSKPALVMHYCSASTVIKCMTTGEIHLVGPGTFTILRSMTCCYLLCQEKIALCYGRNKWSKLEYDQCSKMSCFDAMHDVLAEWNNAGQ